jgi:hypothetical protein
MSGLKVHSFVPCINPHSHLTFTDFVIKYLWSAAGYMLISIPVMLTRRRNVGVQTRSESAEILDGATKTDNAVAKRTESESPVLFAPFIDACQ